jgi:TolB-like protein/tetratricopeptide (TPR) repeat protein
MSFWGELRRRNVYKVGAAYLVAAWLLAQVVALIDEPLGLPVWFDTAVIVLLAVGLPVAVLLAWAYEVTPEGIKKTRQVPLERSITHVTGQKLNYIVTGLIALVVALLVIDNYVLTDRAAERVAGEPADTRSGAEVGSEQEGGESSIAVIPFDNLSSDPEQEYFVDGLSEELLNSLAQLDGLRVIARTSSFAFKDSDRTLREIAEILDVDYVLEGSVRKAGNTIRIVAQLILAEDESHLWSLTYDRELKDVFAIQEEIARAVADEFSTTLGIEGRELFPGGTQNLAAYDHYLRAQSFAQGVNDSERSQAIAEFEAALELDSNFGLAQVRLAQVLTRSASLDPSVDGIVQRRDRAVENAIRLAPDLPATSWLRSQQHLRRLEWVETQQALEEMLARSPANDHEANQEFGVFLMTVGRARESLSYLERARRADPLVAGPSVALAMAHDALGNHDRAVALFRDTQGLAGYGFTAIIPQFYRLLAKRDVAGALAVLGYANVADVPDEPPSRARGAPRAQVALDTLMLDASRHLDNPERGLEIVRAAFEDPNLDTVAGMGNLAFFAAYFGDSALGANAYRRSLLASTVLLQFAWTPIMEPVRGQPEFRDLMREIRLVDLWRQSGWPEHCRPLSANDFECD